VRKQEEVVKEEVKEEAEVMRVSESKCGTTTMSVNPRNQFADDRLKGISI